MSRMEAWNASILQLEPEVLVVELDGTGVLAGAVQHARHLRLAAQAAARTRALNAPRFGFDFDLHDISNVGTRRRRRRLPATRRLQNLLPDSTNKELTELSSQNPHSSPVRNRLGHQPRTHHADLAARLGLGRAGWCRSPPARRSPIPRCGSIAPPDSTGCVQYATTLTAPCSFNALAASHSVLAVSTMSSMITHVRPFTSPMMFITSATLAAAAACR